MIVSSLIGTYLDLWMVGKGLYTFPIRPYPTIFSINILFTLCVLPISIVIMIYFFKRINGWLQLLWLIIISIGLSILEHFSERLGLFIHSNDWKHEYSILGYFVFLLLNWFLYKFLYKY
jgi:hypothetical protein